jgi:3-oxoacyl-(acyl-carrier-protein) synthase
MGIASVFGNDTAAFYDKLLAGTSGISMIERFDTSDYPTRFAGQIKAFECARCSTRRAKPWPHLSVGRVLRQARLAPRSPQLCYTCRVLTPTPQL